MDTEHPTNTAHQLKSFINQNLQEYKETYTGNITDYSLGDQMMADYAAYYDQVLQGGMVGENVPTPQPQPLTRSNVTLHDDIWKKEKNEKDIPETKNSSESQLNLSPPLKNLRIMRSPEQRRPWERGASIMESFSDAESDQSYSSQDTMILKKVSESGNIQAQYLDMLDSNEGGNENQPRAMSRIDRTRYMGLLRQTATSRNSDDDPTPSTSQNPRRVRFADDVKDGAADTRNEETAPTDDHEVEPVPSTSSNTEGQHRTVNVDYSRILNKSSDDNDNEHDFDDGYESTDNASSTSSSSNGTFTLPPSVPEEEEENLELSENIILDTSGNFKTDYGYVNCVKVGSFRRMNQNLRKNMKKGEKMNLEKTNSVENKLKKLFISDDHMDSLSVSGNQGDEPISSPLTTDETELRYTDTYPPNNHLHSWESADLTNYYGSNLTQNSQSCIANQTMDNPSYGSYLEHEDYGVRSCQPREPGSMNQYDNTELMEGTFDEFDGQFHIPDQPRRPAPALPGSPARSTDSYNSLPRGGSSHSSPLHGNQYGSQPDLQSSQPLQNTPIYNRYHSQPHLHENENRTASNWRPVSDLYINDFQQDQCSSVPNENYNSLNIVPNCVYSEGNRSSTSSGVSSYNLGGPSPETTSRENPSNENLNISGSTGSCDSGIDHALSEGPGVVYPNVLHDNMIANKRAPVNYTMDDPSRDPMRLVEKVRRRRDQSPNTRTYGGYKPDGRVPMKSGLLGPAGSFANAKGKDFSQLRKQSKINEGGDRKPMKALPLMKVPNESEANYAESMNKTAKRMLESKRDKMKDDYERYAQLAQRVQRNSYEGSEDSFSDNQSRRSSLPDDQISLNLEKVGNDSSENRVSNPNLEVNLKRSGSSSANIKYMSSADIFKMLQNKSGKPSRNQNSPNPERLGQPSLNADYDYAYASHQEVFNGSNDRSRASFRESRPEKRTSSLDRVNFVRDEYGYVNNASNNANMRHAKNSEIFNLYTSAKTATPMLSVMKVDNRRLSPSLNI